MEKTIKDLKDLRTLLCQRDTIDMQDLKDLKKGETFFHRRARDRPSPYEGRRCFLPLLGP